MRLIDNPLHPPNSDICTFSLQKCRNCLLDLVGYDFVSKYTDTRRVREMRGEDFRESSKVTALLNSTETRLFLVCVFFVC